MIWQLKQVIQSIFIMKNTKSEKFLKMKSQEEMTCGLIL